MYLDLTFETASQYYTHLAMYLNTIILALIVLPLDAQPNEMRAKSDFGSLLIKAPIEEVAQRTATCE